MVRTKCPSVVLCRADHDCCMRLRAHGDSHSIVALRVYTCCTQHLLRCHLHISLSPGQWMYKLMSALFSCSRQHPSRRAYCRHHQLWPERANTRVPSLHGERRMMMVAGVSACEAAIHGIRLSSWTSTSRCNLFARKRWHAQRAEHLLMQEMQTDM
jgi:hypothetical protein